MMPNRKRHKKIQPILILVMLITMGILIVVFLSTRPSRGPAVSAAPAADREATLSIEGIQMTATRNGRSAWDLTALSGNYYNQRQKARFKDISTLFYTNDAQGVSLTADEGSYSSGSNDLEVSGHVVVKNTQYRMKTRRLMYDDHRQSLISNQRVVVWSETTSMSAASMTYNLKTDNITLKGNISGTIRDNIAL